MRRNEVQGLAVPAVDIPKLGLTDAGYRATKSMLFLPPAPEAKSDSYAAQSTHSITMKILFQIIFECVLLTRRSRNAARQPSHGKDAIVEEVLDWRPFHYFTVSTLLPIPGAPKIMMTHAFQDQIDAATHIEMRVAKPKPKDKAFVDQAGAKFKENITNAIGNLRLMSRV